MTSAPAPRSHERESGRALRDRVATLGLQLELECGHLSYHESFRPTALRYHLTFVRHGQTEANVEPRHFQGQVDEPKNQLDGMGRAQARSVAAKLVARCRQGWLPDAIYVSPLRRARDTAAPFLDASGLWERFAVLPAIREMSFGHWDNRRVIAFAPDDPCHLLYREQHALVKGDRGECFVEVVLRAHAVLVELNHRHANHEVLMFSHSMFGAACAILTGNGRHVRGAPHLGFDGPYIFPHAEPVRLA